MFLTASNLVHYLCDRGIISRQSVVSADYCVVEAGRRNRNYKLIRHHAPGLFIKQVQNNDPLAISTLQREVLAYRLAEHLPRLQPLLPKFVHSDEARHILILELLSNAENINEFHYRHKNLSRSMGTLLGQGLADYHSALLENPSPPLLASLPRQIPWILSFHRSYPQMSLKPGERELANLFTRHHDLSANMERLRNSWRYETLIHGDIKWENCMLRSTPAGDEQLTIIDWELLDIGDPAWDVGAVFQSYLTSWINATLTGTGALLPTANGCPPAYVLDAMQPSIHAFWQRYAHSTQLAPSARYPFLIRAIEYAAARLIQTTFEFLATGHSLNGVSGRIMQLAQNMLNQAHHSADVLFGFKAETI